VWARYDAPYVPWFLRRNEILIPIEAGDASSAHPPAVSDADPAGARLDPVGDADG
jgi:hypothetical protein